MQTCHKVRNSALCSMVCFFLAVFFIFQQPLIIAENKFAGMFLHHFFHGNILHLFVNLYVACVLFCRRFSLGETVAAYLIASVSFLCSPVPSIGMSNMLYAIMGLRSPSLRSRWWRSANTIIFLVVTVAYLFVPGISAITHIVSFACGVLLACVVRMFKETLNDYGKAKCKK